MTGRAGQVRMGVVRAGLVWTGATRLGRKGKVMNDEPRNEYGQPLKDVRERDVRQNAHMDENMPPRGSLKEIILNHVEDLVSDFLYYDRKDDEELSAEQLLAALKDGTVSVEEVIERFTNELRTGIEDGR